MSGGQKARIALARAMYARCGIVFLDDPLSALDNIVGGWVFRHAVLEMAAGAAVVMTTHQHQARMTGLFDDACSYRQRCVYVRPMKTSSHDACCRLSVALAFPSQLKSK